MKIEIKVIRNTDALIHEGKFILNKESVATFKIEHLELMKLQNNNILDDTSEGVVAVNINIGTFQKIKKH